MQLLCGYLAISLSQRGILSEKARLIQKGMFTGIMLLSPTKGFPALVPDTDLQLL